MNIGCVLRPPCLSSDLMPLARVLCPAHQIWRRASARTRVGDLIPHPTLRETLVPSLNPSSWDSDTATGSDFRPTVLEEGRRTSAKPLARSTPKLRAPGAVGGMGPRSYADAPLAGALKISRIAAATSLPDIEGDPDSPSRLTFAESHRRRLGQLPERERERSSPSTLDIDGGYRGPRAFYISGSAPGGNI